MIFPSASRKLDRCTCVPPIVFGIVARVKSIEGKNFLFNESDRAGDDIPGREGERK